MFIYWAVALSLTAIAKSSEEKNFTTEAYSGVNLADFDEVAKQYVRGLGRRVDWWDLYGQHWHLQETQKYHKYKIEVWCNAIHYGEAKKTVEKPGYVYTRWFHNDQTVPIQTEFNREVVHENSYSWSIASSVSIGTEIKASATLPGVLGVEASFRASVDLQKSNQQSSSKKETYGAKHMITIPPKKSVKAVFVVTDREVEVPWEADIEISGYIAIWYSQKHEGHWLWFHTITQLANNKFRVSPSGNSLLYRAKGTFHGTRGVDTSLTTSEYNLRSKRSTTANNKILRIKKV